MAKYFFDFFDFHSRKLFFFFVVEYLLLFAFSKKKINKNPEKKKLFQEAYNLSRMRQINLKN